VIARKLDSEKMSAEATEGGCYKHEFNNSGTCVIANIKITWNKKNCVQYMYSR
jgi:hypothetical protein